MLVYLFLEERRFGTELLFNTTMLMVSKSLVNHYFLFRFFTFSNCFSISSITEYAGFSTL
jgi:hypothetical protein